MTSQSLRAEGWEVGDGGTVLYGGERVNVRLGTNSWSVHDGDLFGWLPFTAVTDPRRTE